MSGFIFYFYFFLPSSFCVRKYLRSEKKKKKKESETKPSLLQPKHFFIYFCLFVFWFLFFSPFGIAMYLPNTGQMHGQDHSYFFKLVQSTPSTPN